MKTLINNIKTFLEADITATLINAKVVEKGLPDNFELIPFTQYNYIAIGDGGENAELNNSMESENRNYNVRLVFAVYNFDKAKALDDILDLSDQIKTSLEKESNRLLDGHQWGLTITPFDWEDEKGFYMGRSVTVVYRQLSDTYMEH